MNTLENKAKFFAQYLGQFRLFNDNRVWHTAPVRGDIIDKIDEDCYLLLKPLSSINDEDAVEIKKISMLQNKCDLSSINKIEFIKVKGGAINMCYEYKIHWKLFKADTSYIVLKQGFNLKLSVIDYLRSKGYALPYNGITVEQQIEYGWIKLKE